MSKNIVICCDGTNNDATGHSTNVLRLFAALKRDQNQLTYYDGGVGTLIDPTAMTRVRQLIRKKLDSAIGHSLRENFCKAYRFLARSYEPGDKIFLFGFSRGAYTIRALAGAIHRLGVARPELDGLAEYAWASYSNETRELSERDMFRADARFAKYFSVAPHPRVWFLGAFDTVSALGWIWDYRTLPNTAHNPKIDHVRHAVATDERRACFTANLFYPRRHDQHLSFKQVWFPGVHSDVGGGYPDEDAGLAKLSLQWMLREAEQNGLDVDADIRDNLLGAGGEYSKPDPTARIHESLDWAWWFIEMLPRRVWNPLVEGMRWHRPNCGRRRRYPTNPCIHQSIVDRRKTFSSYDPDMLNRPHTVEE